jgi:hypothetical protein
MNNAVFMRGFKRLADALCDIEGFINGERPTLDAFG